MEERAYTIPLRVVYNRAKRAVRAKRAMKHIRQFVARHMKVSEENVKIHISVNHVVWQRGIQKPPRKVKVVAVKDGEIVWVYTPEERANMVKAAAKKKRTAKRKTAKATKADKETTKAEKASEAQKTAEVKIEKADGENGEEKSEEQKSEEQ